MATTTDQDPISRGGWRERLRRRRGLVAATVIGTAGAVAFVLWWFQPQALLFDDVVDEEFPTVGAGAEQPDDGAGSTDDGADADGAAAEDGATSDSAEHADEAGTTDDADATEPADDTADDMAGDAADDTGDGDTQPMDDADAAEPTEPIALASGEFSSRNRYTVTGEATTYELPDGSRVLRLEDFESTNGPDLFVYLTAADSDASDAELDDDVVDLGVLSGNIGNQNYDIPADVDLDHYDTVVIWCRRFTTSFGAADLS